MWRGQEVYGKSLVSIQFCCESKTEITDKVYSKKNIFLSSGGEKKVGTSCLARGRVPQGKRELAALSLADLSCFCLGHS